MRNRSPGARLVGVLGAVGLLVGVPAAYAMYTDTLVPTFYYSPHCVNGSANGDGEVCQTDNARLTYAYPTTGTFGLEAVDRSDDSLGCMRDPVYDSSTLGGLNKENINSECTN
jgi:hypothetical protein